jgi:hypothetical protein
VKASDAKGLVYKCINSFITGNYKEKVTGELHALACLLMGRVGWETEVGE